MRPDSRVAVHDALEPADHPTRLSWSVEAVLIAAIAGSVIAAIWGTVPGLSHQTLTRLGDVALAAFAVFVAEYLARLFSAAGRDPDAASRPWQARWLYARSVLGVIDLLVILPQLLHAVGWLDADEARLGAVLALVKIARYAPALPLVISVFRNEGRSLLAALTVMLVLMVLAASVMYTLEHRAQPQLFSSIPACLWWAIVTIASVGYGDMIPVTLGGRIVAGVVMLLGIAMFAVPAGILATGFASELRRRDFVVTWNTVAKVPLFANLDAAGIAAIARLLKPQIVPAHYAVVRRGEPATAMYFIMTGEVEVDVPPNPVRLRAGQFFGEIALLRQMLRTATVTAVTETQLLTLEASDFRKLIDEFPDLRERISRIAEGRLGTPPTPTPPTNPA